MTDHTVFQNLTPHTINETVSGRNFPPSGEVARVSVEYVPAGEIDGIPVFAAEYGDVTGLPEPKPGTVYIVSGLVLARCSERSDVVAPGDLVRDDAGKPVGCRGFKRG